jgi:UDPglucose--hexose-1-phosphate uridylyltransferase
VPDVRFDSLGRRHVILAPERARRGAPEVEPFAADPAPCDFCGGREDRTPPETFSIREPGTEPNTPGWRVRVVPNLYPATALHEVVVHTPDHYEHFEDQDGAHRTDVLRAYRARMRDVPTEATIIVWNRGRAAGASRTHAHGQIFGLDVVPPTLQRESSTFGEDTCALCQLGQDADLHIVERDGYLIMAHPVPFVADELLVVPPHSPRFEDLDDLAPTAEALASTLRLLAQAVPFNLVFHSAPTGADRFHWHAHLMPRTAVWGGLEMGAELPIVAADPYETARRLRDS